MQVLIALGRAAAAAAELSVRGIGAPFLPLGEPAATRKPRANRAVSPSPENSAPDTTCSIEAIFARWRLAAKGATGPM